jgi:uncharacterized phage infection (PIP) family protein YhgE
VTDIMGEISAASSEQSSGVAQVGEAVTQMDQATQQNAALVEEMAAAASSLRGQAQDLVQTVAVFKLRGAATTTVRPAEQVMARGVVSPVAAAAKPAVKVPPVLTRKAAAPTATAVKAADKEDEAGWASF